MRALVAVLAILALAGCGPDCALEYGEGSTLQEDGLVRPGDKIVFEAHLYGSVYTCGGHWLVNGIEGGGAGVGTIDECGVYQAPAQFAPGLYEIVVEGSFPGVSEPTLDGCEHAFARLHPAR